MQKGFKILNLRSAMPLGLMAAGLTSAGLITGFAVAVLPGRADQEALSPVVLRRDASVILAQRMNPCLCRNGASPQPLPGTPGNVEFIAGCSDIEHHSAGFGD